MIQQTLSQNNNSGCMVKLSTFILEIEVVLVTFGTY